MATSAQIFEDDLQQKVSYEVANAYNSGRKLQLLINSLNINSADKTQLLEAVTIHNDHVKNLYVLNFAVVGCKVAPVMEASKRI